MITMDALELRLTPDRDGKWMKPELQAFGVVSSTRLESRDARRENPARQHERDHEQLREECDWGRTERRGGTSVSKVLPPRSSQHRDASRHDLAYYLCGELPLEQFKSYPSELFRYSSG